MLKKQSHGYSGVFHWKQIFVSIGLNGHVCGFYGRFRPIFMFVVFKERSLIPVVVMNDDNEKSNRYSFWFLISEFTRKSWLHNVTADV